MKTSFASQCVTECVCVWHKQTEPAYFSMQSSPLWVHVSNQKYIVTFVEQERVFRQRHMLLESWTWKYTYLNTPSLGYLSINMNHNNNHFNFTISGMLKIIHFKKTMSNPCDKEVHFTFTYKNNKSVWTEWHVFGHVIYNQMKMYY